MYFSKKNKTKRRSKYIAQKDAFLLKKKEKYSEKQFVLPVKKRTEALTHFS